MTDRFAPDSRSLRRELSGNAGLRVVDEADTVPTVDAVFFDLYGTLVDIRTDETSAAAWDALRSALSDCGVTYAGNAELQRRFETLAQPIRDAAVAAHGEWAEPDLLPVYAALAGECRNDDAMARSLAWTFRQASTSLLRVYPGAPELLARLRVAGKRVVLVSNAQSCYTRPELAALGLDRAFDRIVISSEVGVRKPSPAIFRRALETEHLTPDRVLMVGNDERAEILGAASAGIAGVYLRTEISPASDSQVSAHAALSLAGPDYAELLQYLT